MDALQFIQSDIKRGKRKTWIYALLALVTFLLPIAFGIGLRDDYGGVFDLRVLIPNLTACLLLAFGAFLVFKSRFSSSRIFNWTLIALGIGLILATERVLFPAGPRTTYASAFIFWEESGRCFFKGALEGIVLGGCLSLFALFFSSWPAHRWRVLISVTAGVSGAIMLGFHCDSSSPFHVLIGHIGQGVFAGFCALFFQNRIFTSKMKNLFPNIKDANKF